jgi:hypothetical protein
LLALLVPPFFFTDAEGHVLLGGWEDAGASFAGCTGTKVQILTQKGFFPFSPAGEMEVSTCGDLAAFATRYMHADVCWRMLTYADVC